MKKSRNEDGVLSACQPISSIARKEVSWDRLNSYLPNLNQTTNKPIQL